MDHDQDGAATVTAEPVSHPGHELRAQAPTVATKARLSDGRSIVYFTSGPPSTPPAIDLRPTMPPAPASTVRWDPLFEDVAVIAGHRQQRICHPVPAQCPLCPSRPDAHTEIPADRYEVVAFENRFPAFTAGPVPVAGDADKFPTLPSAGRCEVLCYSDSHETVLADIPATRVRIVVDAWAHRTAALAQDEHIRYVLCFENHGSDIGVTLSHPHGQIYGYPFVPPRFERAAASTQRHHAATGRCLQCDQLLAELSAGTRIVAQTRHWVAYVPFAARWPFELRLVPRKHHRGLVSLDNSERDDLAAVYPDLLARFSGLFDAPTGYIAAWLQAPVRCSDNSWHLAAELFTTRRATDKLKFLAGAESVATTWINDVSPEEAADRLRQASH